MGRCCCLRGICLLGKIMTGFLAGNLTVVEVNTDVGVVDLLVVAVVVVVVVVVVVEEVVSVVVLLDVD